MVEDELDILLVSCEDSEAATLWVNYLISCFQQISRERNKPPFKLQNIKLEDMLCPSSNTNNLADKLPEARLQIVVICSEFLEKIQNTPIIDNHLPKIIHPDKVLAMMLGVQDQIDNNKMKTILQDFEQWRKMNVKDQDPTFVGDFLGVSMDILNRNWQLQEMMNTKQDQADFSVIPKKVKQGQNKLIILLTDPLSTEDHLQLFVYKGGQRIDVATVKRRNPYTLQFTMPSCCLQVSMLVSVHVEKNGTSMGRRMVKCESQMRELEQLLKSIDKPVEFLCQSFGLNTNNRDQLDTLLVNNFQRNLPSNFNLLATASPTIKHFTCNEEYPTLLHFSAKYGLERLSWQLLESAGGEQACHIRNSSHLTPSDLAQKFNHVNLANILRGFMQMTELASVYNYLKGMSERGRPEFNYPLARPLNDTYLIPPAARPVDPAMQPNLMCDYSTTSLPYYANFKPCNFSVLNATSPTSSVDSSAFLAGGLENYDIPSNGRPCTPPTPRSPIECKIENYLDMHSAENNSSRLSSASSYNTTCNLQDHFESYSKFDTCERASVSSENHSPSKYGSVNQLSYKEKLSPDDELLEIINDFKNNVFTIVEVERLVENWLSRNDVQQSFRDRQEQLNKMREEYDRIQRKVKEDMKRTTPFERIRKLFHLGKAKHCESSSSITSDMSTLNIRPTSSLSLHSSSSGSSGVGNMSERYVTVPSVKLSSCEKLNNKWKCQQNEIPQPPKYLDLSLNVDFSEYVQPDATSSSKTNNRQSCNGSILNDTIRECNEPDDVDYATTSHLPSPTTDKHYKKLFHRIRKANSNETCAADSVKHKAKTTHRKVGKSVEALADNHDYTKMNNPNEAESQSTPAQDVKCSNNSVCAALCAETLRCFSDVSIVSTHQEPSATEITFQFNKAANCCTPESESNSHSHNSSSLDLSSLSVNSTATGDGNCETNDEKQSLQLDITEEGQNGSQTATPSIFIPEYVNVNLKIKRGAAFNEGHEHTFLTT